MLKYIFSAGTDTDCSMSGEEEEDPEEYIAALGTRPPLFRENYDQSFTPIIDLFYWCSFEEPDKRPSSKQVVEVLRPHAEKIFDK